MARLPLRHAHFARVLLGSAIVLSLCSQGVMAQDVLVIEEHWELHVGGPDAARSAPQVTMTMSPFGHVDQDYFLVTLNHRTYPDFAAGGLQVQRWFDDTCFDAKQSSDQSMLTNGEEVVSWVQRLSLVEGHLKFEVINGNSETWGSFGGNGTLKLMVPTQLTRLNSYRPAVSVSQSGISYAGNRVSSLILKRLEWDTIDGEHHVHVAPIDISLQLDP